MCYGNSLQIELNLPTGSIGSSSTYACRAKSKDASSAKLSFFPAIAFFASLRCALFTCAMLCRRTRFSRSAFGLRAEGRTSASEVGTTEDGKGRAGFAQRMEMLRLCAVSPETCQRGFVRVDRQRTALWPTRSKLALVKSGLWIQ